MNKKVSKKSKRRLMTFGIFSIFAIGYFCFTLIGYIYNYASLKNEEKNLQAQLLNLQEQKQELKIEIQKLNDPTYAIRYAKEKFLYSSEGEYVIKLNPTETTNVVENKPEQNYVIPIIIGSVLMFLVILVIVQIKNKQKKYNH